MQLPPNCLIKNPAGSYSFVGRVDARLGYLRKDGSEPSEQEMQTAARHGPRLAGLVTRTFPTYQAGLDAAAAIGATVTP